MKYPKLSLSPKIVDMIRKYQRELSNTLNLSKRFLQLTQKALKENLSPKSVKPQLQLVKSP